MSLIFIILFGNHNNLYYICIFNLNIIYIWNQVTTKLIVIFLKK